MLLSRTTKLPFTIIQRVEKTDPDNTYLLYLPGLLSSIHLLGDRHIPLNISYGGRLPHPRRSADNSLFPVPSLADIPRVGQAQEPGGRAADDRDGCQPGLPE